MILKIKDRFWLKTIFNHLWFFYLHNNVRDFFFLGGGSEGIQWAKLDNLI